MKTRRGDSDEKRRQEYVCVLLFFWGGEGEEGLADGQIDIESQTKNKNININKQTQRTKGRSVCVCGGGGIIKTTVPTQLSHGRSHI